MQATKGWNEPVRFQAPGEELARELRRVRLFAELDEEAVREVARRALPRTLPRRARLFRKGERCAGLHVVLEGRLEVYASAPDGREQVLHRIGARQAVTELPLFDGAAYPASARAVTEARVVFIPAEVVERLCREHPELLRVVIADLGRSIRRLTQLVEKVSLKDVRARVATALLEQASGEGTGAGGGSFVLGWTQEQMAHALGVTRESVARGLARLRRAGLIEQEGRRVRILELDALAAVADGGGRAPGREGGRTRPDRLGAYGVGLEGPCC